MAIFIVHAGQKKERDTATRVLNGTNKNYFADNFEGDL